MVLLSSRPARIQQVFDLRDKPKDGWRLGPELRKIETEVMAALLAD